MALEIDADIPAHDNNLIGDQLSTLVVNYRWRRLITPLLRPLLRDHFWTGTDAEIEDATAKARAMLDDLYDIGGHGLDYAGALVQRNSLFTFGTTEEEIRIEDDSTLPLHDEGGFFDGGLPFDLIIPTGLDGYYRIFAQANLRSGTPQAFLRIKDSSLLLVAGARTNVTGFVTLAAAATLFASGGDSFSVFMQTDTGTRDIVSSLPVSGSARFGMYRVGLAP